MFSIFLLPGDVVCDLTGAPTEYEHRQDSQSFTNMTVWSAVATGAAVHLLPMGMSAA